MPTTLPFPQTTPPGFEPLADEVAFDPDRHLDLTEPDEVVTLAELGYSPAEIAPTATPVAVSSPFRVLSDEGAEVMLHTARQLRRHATRAGSRIEHVVRGGCYRSRWFRDLCTSPEVTDHLAGIYGVPIAPHTMPHHLGHLNFEPDQVGDAVDKWHHDTIPLDYVMVVSDPATLPGGRFEWFRGTKHEAAELARRGATPPPARVVQPHFGGAGWAIALHGDMVVHRGGPLTAPAERITMVNAYVATDRSGHEQSRTADLIGIDPDDALYAEWVRHVAWRAAGRLDELAASTPFGLTPEDAVTRLRDAVADVSRAIEEIAAGAREPDHYERPAGGVTP